MCSQQDSHSFWTAEKVSQCWSWLYSVCCSVKYQTWPEDINKTTNMRGEGGLVCLPLRLSWSRLVSIPPSGRSQTGRPPLPTRYSWLSKHWAVGGKRKWALYTSSRSHTSECHIEHKKHNQSKHITELWREDIVMGKDQFLLDWRRSNVQDCCFTCSDNESKSNQKVWPEWLTNLSGSKTISVIHLPRLLFPFGKHGGDTWLLNCLPILT